MSTRNYAAKASPSCCFGRSIRKFTLPVQAYQYAEWKKATVNVDYHIEVARHYYSVPYTLIKKRIDVRLTDTTVECFYKAKRVASHIRSHHKARHCTIKEHMPKAHQKWA
jgi:transposase